jgi:hypothetical protein
VQSSSRSEPGLDLRFISSGVDTLELWFSWGTRFDLPESFLESLNTARDRLRFEPRSNPVVPCECLCISNPHQASSVDGGLGIFQRARYRSVRHYSFALVLGDESMIVAFANPNKGSRRPGQNQIHVTLNARYLSAMGDNISEIVTMLKVGLCSLVGAHHDMCRVSRVDLRSDLGSIGPMFEMSDLDRFVSWARIRRPFLAAELLPDGFEGHQASGEQAAGPTLRVGAAANGDATEHVASPLGNTGDDSYKHSRGRLLIAETPFENVDAALDGLRWSGFRFGANALLARLYSKTVQSVRDHRAKDYLNSMELREDEHVTRLEFQLRSDVLEMFRFEDRVLDLRDWDVLEQHLGNLWEYLTRWLSLRIPSETDKNRWRWDIDPTWLVFRESWGSSGEALKRVNPPPSGQVVALLSQAAGCIVSASACLANNITSKAVPNALINLFTRHLDLPEVLLPKSITTDWFETFNNRLVKFAGISGYFPQPYDLPSKSDGEWDSYAPA